MTNFNIAAAGNHIMQQGFTKQEAISLIIATLVDEGFDARTAYEAVFGEGSYRELSDLVYDQLNEA